jgi:hypothetical protein
LKENYKRRLTVAKKTLEARTIGLIKQYGVREVEAVVRTYRLITEGTATVTKAKVVKVKATTTAGVEKEVANG